MIPRKQLQQALKLVGQAITTGTAIPVLSGVRLSTGPDGLTLTGSDLTLTISTTLPGIEGVDAIVSAQLLAAFVGKAEDDISIGSADDGRVRVTSGAASLDLRAFPGDDWPTLPTVEGDPVTVTADTADAILSVLYAAAGRDDARPVLTAAMFGDGKVACTDSYRLACVEVDIPGVFLIPARTLAYVLRSTDDGFTLVADDRHASIRAGGTTWTTALIAGKAPNYQQLIPTDTLPYVLDVDRDGFLHALDRVTSTWEKDGPPLVRLEPDNGEVRLCVQGPTATCTETIPGKFTSPEPISFNFHYLRDVAESDDDVRFVFELDTPDKAGVVRGDTSVAALMPVRTN